MRGVLFIVAILLFAFAANAQTSHHASQNVRIKLTDVIAIAVANPNANINFTSISHFANGVESDPQALTISSNKNWQLEMKAEANFLDNTNSLTMPITGGIFTMKVAIDPTNITIANGFNSYTQVAATNQVIISSGTKGELKPVTIQYRVNPGFQYPGGSYSNTVTYTATQL